MTSSTRTNQVPGGSTQPVLLRLERAREHQASARAIHDEFVQEAIGLTAEHDAESGWTSLHLTFSREFPGDQLAIILGDTLGSARSAFDYLAWQLVLQAGNTPSKQTNFPFARTSQSWSSAVGSSLKGVAPIWIAQIDKLQPYHAVDPQLHELTVLDDMNNLIKHRLIPATLHQVHQLNLSEVAVTPGVTYDFEHNWGVVSNGQWVFRARGSDGAQVDLLTNADVEFRVSFDDATGRTWNTEDILDWAEKSIQKFAPAFL
jgi:hypothetical protein